MAKKNSCSMHLSFMSTDMLHYLTIGQARLIYIMIKILVLMVNRTKLVNFQIDCRQLLSTRWPMKVLFCHRTLPKRCNYRAYF